MSVCLFVCLSISPLDPHVIAPVQNCSLEDLFPAPPLPTWGSPAPGPTPLLYLFRLFTCNPYVYWSSTERASSYHPQTKLWEGNVFTPVYYSVDRGVFASGSGGGLCPHGHTPPWHTPLDIPLGQTPSSADTSRQAPDWADIPLGRNPPSDTLPARYPRPDTIPHHRDDHWRGGYASYWNAFLFGLCSQKPR